jgi:uncharacterized protein (TIGR00295 family)
MIPDEEEAVLLLEKVGCDRKVIEHCKAVQFFASKIAERLIKNGIEVDTQLVRIGALLHDIGRARSHRVDHGVMGGRMAREMQLGEEVARIIERHVGAGIPAAEAEVLGLPAKDYIPETIEEKIVAHADNMVLFKKHPIDKTLAKLDRKGKMEAKARMEKLHEELSELAGIDLNDL